MTEWNRPRDEILMNVFTRAMHHRPSVSMTDYPLLKSKYHAEVKFDSRWSMVLSQNHKISIHTYIHAYVHIRRRAMRDVIYVITLIEYYKSKRIQVTKGRKIHDNAVRESSSSLVRSKSLIERSLYSIANASDAI